MDIINAVDALSALAQPTRLAVFRRLVAEAPEGMASGAIADALGVPANTMSAHLAILTRGGLVASRRESRSIIYSADQDGMRELLAFLVADCCGGRPEMCGPLVALAQRACGAGPTRRRRVRQ